MGKEKQDLRAKLKQKPGKAAMLALLMAGALWSWSGIAFGGDDQDAALSATPSPAQAATTPQASAARVPGAPAPAAQATSDLNSFQAAMDRLAGWKEALKPDDLVPEGPVSVPSGLEDDPFETEGRLSERAGVVVEIDEVPALTGTALFGERRFAVFGDLRVQEGQRIGRYVVAAVRSREVDLQDGNHVLTLKIRQPELSKRQDSLSKDQ